MCKGHFYPRFNRKRNIDNFGYVFKFRTICDITIFTTLRLLNKKIVHKFIDLLYNDIEWRMI